MLQWLQSFWSNLLYKNIFICIEMYENETYKVFPTCNAFVKIFAVSIYTKMLQR